MAISINRRSERKKTEEPVDRPTTGERHCMKKKKKKTASRTGSYLLLQSVMEKVGSPNQFCSAAALKGREEPARRGGEWGG